jgi:hypothetical protein
MLHKLGVDYLDDLPKPKDSYQLCIDYLNRRGLLGMDFEEIISLICPIVFEVNQDISEFVGNSAYFSTAGSNNEMEVSRGLTKITENHLFKNLTDQEIVDVAVSITGVNQNDI